MDRSERNEERTAGIVNGQGSRKDNPPPLVSSGTSSVTYKGSSSVVPPASIIPTSMTTTQRPIKILWRPNNYRRKMIAHDLVNSAIAKIKECYQILQIAPHSKLLFIRDYPGVLLQIGKSTIIGIWSQPVVKGVKQTVLLEGTPQDIDERLVMKRDEIAQQIDTAMLGFCERLELQGAGVIMWDRYEDWIKGEEYIDRLPVDCIIHDTYFKKVYGEGIEFKQTSKKEAPGVHVKNYIKNRAVEDIAPEIARSMESLALQVMLLSPLQRVKELVVEWPGDCLRGDVMALVHGMSVREREVFEEWVFAEFGRSL